MIFIFEILLLITAITAIVETILAATWNKYYFLHGIPVFIKEMEIQNLSESKQEIFNFINNMDAVKGFSKYKGTQIDENNFAFRKKMVFVSCYRNDFDNIYGIISFDEENRTLKIKGYAGFTFLAIMLTLAAFFMDDSEFSFVKLLIVLFLVIIFSLMFYAFERRKYNKLANEISNIINK